MKNVHILLVDDSPSDQVMIERAFEDSEFSCTLSIANNGQAALDFLLLAKKEKRLPSLLLLDINMPVMDGLETLRSIRENPGISHIPIIMLTSSNAERDVTECYKLGCNAYITKPASDTEVLQTVLQIQSFWFSTAVLPSI